MHIPHAIAPHIVHVDIKDVGTFTHLGTGKGNEAIPVFGIEEIAAFFRATGIEPLTNDQEGILLVVGLRAVDRGSRGNPLGRSHLGGQGGSNFGKGSNVIGRVPQQPPITCTPKSSTKRVRASRSSIGVNL